MHLRQPSLSAFPRWRRVLPRALAELERSRDLLGKWAAQAWGGEARRKRSRRGRGTSHCEPDCETLIVGFKMNTVGTRKKVNCAPCYAPRFQVGVARSVSSLTLPFDLQRVKGHTRLSLTRISCFCVRRQTLMTKLPHIRVYRNNTTVVQHTPLTTSKAQTTFHSRFPPSPQLRSMSSDLLVVFVVVLLGPARGLRLIVALGRVPRASDLRKLVVCEGEGEGG